MITLVATAPIKNRAPAEPTKARARRWLEQVLHLKQTASEIASREHISVRTVQLALKWARQNPRGMDEAMEVKAAVDPPELPASWAKEFRSRPEYDTPAVNEWLASVRTRRRGRAG